jgi:hypothetical protein
MTALSPTPALRPKRATRAPARFNGTVDKANRKKDKGKERRMWLFYIVEVLALLLSFRTHPKNTLKSGDTIFYMARKSLFFLGGLFHVYKKFYKTRDIPIIFLKFINIATYSWIPIIISASDQFSKFHRSPLCWFLKGHFNFLFVSSAIFSSGLCILHDPCS